MRFIFIVMMLMCLAVGMLDIMNELKEIKHMVNEVICTALELEE
jgi:hypothetical protein